MRPSSANLFWNVLAWLWPNWLNYSLIHRCFLIHEEFERWWEIWHLLGSAHWSKHAGTSMTIKKQFEVYTPHVDDFKSCLTSYLLHRFGWLQFARAGGCDAFLRLCHIFSSVWNPQQNSFQIHQWKHFLIFFRYFWTTVNKTTWYIQTMRYVLYSM